MTAPFIPPYEKHFLNSLAGIKAEGRYRIFTPISRLCGNFPKADLRLPDGRTKQVTVWCGNDYLGMGQNPSVLKAMHDAVDEFGSGSGGTRNISGNMPLHAALEEELADLHQQQAALVFNSGYMANATTLATLAKILPGAIFFSDAKNHASMIEGIRHTRCEKHIFEHNNPEHLRTLLAAAPADSCKIVVFESVYSMDATFAPLTAMLDVAQEFGAFTYLDEVHAVGLYGMRGAGVAERDAVLNRISLIQGTLGKAFGMIGGYIAANRSIIDAIRSSAPGFIFTTSLPPVIAAGALASVRYVKTHPALRTQHQQIVQDAKDALHDAGLPLLETPSHILPLHIGDARMAKTLSDVLLHDFSIYVQPINYPTVPRGSERFRITPTPLHTQEHIAELVHALQETLHARHELRVAE
ncbi:MAG: 5-aminolevulinate synthase [Alphaproteobacteria bacterium]|nr:5-aminolevulinate synthase [Alphaproteobacteria bacterium]